MTLAILDQIVANDEGFMDRFQWIGCMLLKSATILRCSKPIVSSGIQASKEVKDLGESICLLKVEK